LLNIAALPPFKDDIRKLRDYLAYQVEHSEIQVHLNTAYQAGRLEQEQPAHIVVATGSRSWAPAIKGWEPGFCWKVDQVLRQEVCLEGKKILVIGGGRSGCEVADYLLGQGNRVTIAEMERFLASNMEKKNRRALMNRLEDGRVDRLLSSRVLSVSLGQALLINERGQEIALEVDAVVGAAGFVSLNELFFQLEKVHGSVHIIGDAYQVKGIKQALDQGEMLARHLQGTRGGRRS